ncbi:hypothetical protein ACTACD_14225 [Pseudomonas syringae]|uniref:hypothetical protein n=1 Tax=Pseudomonas syringae TaxID=317 RepID=UPI003F761FFE
MTDNVKEKRTRTQQGAFRRDRNAVQKAEREGITDKDIILKLAETHSKPYSPQAFAEAAGALIHLRANMDKTTPVADAVDALQVERFSLNKAATE